MFRAKLVISTQSNGDETYLNYVAAINNRSTFQYYLVVKARNLNTGQTREICTQGSLFLGALHREYKLGYDKESIEKVRSIAINNKGRYFEFKNDSALLNMGINDYTENDLKKLEGRVNFDALAKKIKRKREWELSLDDSLMTMYAHLLFNKGILTGENNCWAGRLEYVSRKRAAEEL